MRRFYQLLVTFSLLFASTFCALSTSAQITATNYYYNDFEANSLGANITQTSTDASLQLSNTLPLSGAYSLSSTGNGKVGTYRFSFINAGTSLNNDAERYGWEWTMVYRNTGGNTDDATTIDNNENSWKYWLYSNNTDVSNMQGFYLTQVGSSLYIYMRINTENRLVLSYNLSSIGGNNTTYAIRIQRLNVNGYTFRLFVDPYTPSKQMATTLRAQLLNSGDNNTYSKYNYSGLQLASTTAGRFKFDEVKMYSRKIEIIVANDVSNGISNPLYNGQKDAVIYGLKFKTRGLFTEAYKIRLEIEQTGWYSFADIVENARLFRSEDDYFGNSDDVLIDKNQAGGPISVVIDYRALYADDFQTQIFASVGASDGSLVDVGSLFFKVDVKADASEKGTFTVKRPTFIGNDNSSINYVNEPGVLTNNTSTPPVAAGKVFDWIGGTSGNLNSWNTAGNWFQNAVPGANDLARIGVLRNFTHQPTVSTGTTIGNLIIGGTQSSLIPTLSINASTSLTINGTFTNSRESKISGAGSLLIIGSWATSGGKIDLTAGTVTVNFTGTKAQSIRDEGSDAGRGVVFGNIGFSNAGLKTFGGSGKFALAVGKYLTMGSNTTLQTSGMLTLKSSVDGSASVAQIPSGSSILGNVTVERYIQGGSKSMWRTYRMFSSPVYDNGNAASRTYSFAQFIDDMLVTGKSAGFDQLGNSATSAWTYNNGFIAIPSINTAVNVGRGSYLLYRGDRSNPTGKVTSPYVDVESIVMTYKGVLNQQNVAVPLTHGSTTYSLLGNPYAATVDWNAVTKTNVSNVIRTWNPSSRQYATFNGVDQTNGGSQFIGPGQGFFVQTTSGSSPSVTFTESSKISNVSQVTPLYNKVMAVREQSFGGETTLPRANVEEAPAKIRIKLTREGFENEDETLVVLKRNESANVEGYDVERSGGEAVFLSSLSAEKNKMTINYMPHISTLQSVKLDVDVANNGDYKMHFILTGVPVGYEVKLNDRYLNTITDLANEGTVYSLAIDKAVAASMGDRFELLVAPAKALPVVLANFTGDKTINGASLKWKTSSEVNNSGFEVQRAGDDQSFATIGTVTTNNSGSYNFLDKTPLNGNNHYRLAQVGYDGKLANLANTVDLKFDLNDASGIVIYPTLVQTTFTMKFVGSLSAKQYVFKVSDATGKEIYNKGLSKEEIDNGFVGELSTIPSGVYFAALFDSTNGSKIGVTKLIKK